MDKFVQTELEGAGVNVEETLRRFMNNEMLMIKFLRKFVDDENMNKLRTLIADKHYNEVLPVAHTLKGVSGNLGLIKLYEIFSRMCQDCRNDQYEDLDGLFAQARPRDFAENVPLQKGRFAAPGPGRRRRRNAWNNSS